MSGIALDSPVVTSRPRLRTGISAFGAVRAIVLAPAAAIASAGLLSYFVGSNLQSAVPGPTPYSPNTAIAISLLVVAVALDPSRGARLLGAFAGLIGLLTGLEYLLSANLHIDQSIFHSIAEHPNSVHPGRMAPNTAAAVALAGFAIVLRGRVSVALATVTSLTGLFGVLGYTDPHATALATIGGSVGMIVPTGAALACCSFALVLGREPDFFTRRSVGGTLLRRLLPAGIGLPLVGGVLLVRGTASGAVSGPVGAWLLMVATIVGSTAVVIWMSRVLDRQEEREQALLSLHAAMAENLVEGLCLRRESDGTIVSVNPALERIFGYTSGSLQGTDTKLLPPEEDERLRAMLLERGSWTTEANTLRADGNRFWCSVKASRFVHPRLGPLRVALYHDITDQRRAEQARGEAEQARRQAIAELRRSNIELEQFAHVASHDLSEPLNVVGGFVGTLQDRYAEQLDEDAHQLIDATVSGVDRMHDLIDALLSYSRVGAEQIEPAPVAVVESVAAALRTMEPRIEATGAHIEIGELPTVWGDQALLDRLFQNLISNAIKFAGERPPRVAVSAAPDGAGGWELAVADEGIGIAAQDVERAFGMFQRLQGREQPGTGIGLAISRRIVERLGGRIWAEPAVGPRGGTVFRLTLPSCAPVPSPARRSDALLP